MKHWLIDRLILKKIWLIDSFIKNWLIDRSIKNWLIDSITKHWLVDSINVVHVKCDGGWEVAVIENVEVLFTEKGLGGDVHGTRAGTLKTPWT